MLKLRAYTLIELLLGLALLAILLFFSLPFASSMHQKNQIQVIKNDIKSAIRFAKTHALMSGKNVILAPLQHSVDWSSGMLLYLPENKLLHEWRWQAPGIHVAWHGFQSNHYLLFSADASQNAVNGYFEIHDNMNQKVTLVLNRLGRVREKEC